MLSSRKVCNVLRSIRNRSVKPVPSEATRVCEMIEREAEGSAPLTWDSDDEGGEGSGAMSSMSGAYP